MMVIWAEAIAAAAALILFRCVLFAQLISQKQNVEQNDKEISETPKTL